MSDWSRVGSSGGGAAVKVRLRRGASIKAEPDALITMSHHVELGASMDGGLMRGIFRSALGGESIFAQTLRAASGDGDVVLAAPDVGDIELIRLGRDAGGPSSMLLAKGAFLASDEGIKISSTVQNNIAGALTSGTGLFVLRASGRGTLAVSAHGSILAFDLDEGEERAVDNGHLVGWSESMAYSMKMAGGARGGSLLSSFYSSAASGEGLMCYFRGPGRVLLQTHKPQVVIEKDGTKMRTTGGGSGAAGGLAGCCVCCVFFLIAAAILGVIFVIIPSNGGKWVQHAPGQYHVEWDPPPPPRSTARLRDTYEAPYHHHSPASKRRASSSTYDEL